MYVDPNATGVEDGTTWATAYRSLASALMMTISGQQIHVADGTYKPTSGTDCTISFQLKTGVAIYGGYAGYGAANPDARNVMGTPSVLSGDIGTAGAYADNSSHVVVGGGTDSTSILDGFTICAGYAAGGGYGNYGGGMYNSGGSPTVRNCTFIGNVGIFGGGMYNGSSSTPTLTNCTFIDNWVSGFGGGMDDYSSSPKLTNCTFLRNSAWGNGEAIYNDTSSPTLTNCIIWGSGNSPIYNNYSSSAPVISFSDIQGGYPGPGNINSDPLFVRSPWAGSDGVFGTADDDLGDLHLRAGSPALDVGSYAAIPTGVTTDLAGNPRIQNGTVDLGAFEGPVSAPAPKTIYVDLGAVGANTGTSWTNAFANLQSALLAATDGDTIRIADGAYKPTTTTDRTISFALRNAVAIYGGYAGYGASNPDARNVAAYPTILSGDIGVTGNSSDNSYHVVTANGVDASAVLDGVTVTLGNANGSVLNQTFAGGLLATSSSATLTNCAFSGNSASDCGGAMYNYFSFLTLTDCMFVGNSAAVGGGIYDDAGSMPTLTNCVFNGNSTSNSGGAMYIYYSMGVAGPSIPTLVNCIVWGNTPSGSQIYGSATVTYSDIQAGYTGTGNLNADPVFTRTPSAGTDGKWGTSDDDYGDLRLQPTSPCIDAGSNAAIPTGVTTDLAGGPRFMDVLTTPDTGSGTAPIVDMGAYERKGLLTINGTSGSGSYDVNLTPDQATLQIWTGSTADGTPMATFPVATIDSCQFGVSAGSNTLTLDVSNGVPPVGLTFTSGGGNNTLIFSGFSATNTVNIQPTQVLVNSTVVATSNVETILLNAPAGSTLGLASLTLSQPAALVAGNNLTLRVGSLSITSPGSLNLAGNSMILDYTASPVAQVQGWINNGRMGVTPALKTTGTPSLGMVDNALLHLAGFAGQSLGGVFSQLLIQSTVAGDTNLDGKVDQSDYLNIIANMGNTGAQWFLGDLNGDGVVTPDDLAIVSANLGAGTSLAAGPSLFTASPANAPAAANPTSAAPLTTNKTPVAKATKPVVHATRPVPHHKQPKVIHSVTKHT
jgi:hypothetical protein